MKCFDIKNKWFYLRQNILIVIIISYKYLFTNRENTIFNKI